MRMYGYQLFIIRTKKCKRFNAHAKANENVLCAFPTIDDACN